MQSRVPIIKASNEEVVFHQTLRSTITQLDVLRIQTAISSLAVVSALFASAIALLVLDPNRVFTAPVGAKWGAAMSIPVWFLGSTASRVFKSNLDLFGEFLELAVRVSLDVEAKILTSERHKITKLFDAKTNAGARNLIVLERILDFFKFFGYAGCVWGAVVFIVSLRGWAPSFLNTLKSVY